MVGMSMKSISHAPNTDRIQQGIALQYLLLPWKWFSLRSGKHVKSLENRFSALVADDAKTYSVSAFSAGREALYAILNGLGLREGDEVIVQAYTCIVVPNSIIWNKAKPVYVDIDSSYNLDPANLEQAITDKTKAIIVQHTFGYPADMQSIMKIANKHNIPVIEDCAHSLGATINSKPVGTFGMAALFSFGRDKMISSVAGGVAVTSDPELASAIKDVQATSPQRTIVWTLQNLLHPLIVPISSKLSGRLKIGQFLLFLSQKLSMLNKVYEKGECRSEIPSIISRRMPNAMALLVLKQLETLKENLQHRKRIADSYSTLLDDKAIRVQSYTRGEPSYLRYTIEVEHPTKTRMHAKKAGYLLGNWYSDIIMPTSIDLDLLHYRKGSCPNAELLVTKNVNLPTSRAFSLKDAEHIAKIVKEANV